MTVRIEKPAVNVREKLAELDKPTGIAGEAMLRAETPQEQFNLIGAGRRNLLINGSVQVWQKGTSQTYTNGYKNGGPDHMTTYYGGTYTQQFATIPNGQYVSALRYTADSSTNASPNFNWIIEDGGKFLRNQVVTLGWWMRASKSGIYMAARVNNVVNSTYTGGGSNYALGVSSGYIYPATTEWSYHTRTIQLPSTFTHDHSLAEIWSTAGSMDSGDWFEITQVQLELGKVATPFEHRSYGEELALCQRYYQKFGSNNTYDVVAFGGTGVSATQVQCATPLIVPMRVSPSLSTNDIQIADAVNPAIDCTSTAVSSGVTNNKIAFIQYNVSSGVVQYRPYYIRVSNNASGYIAFDAEL